MGKDDDDDPKNRIGMSRKIVLAAICSISAVVLLITVLHLYFRYLQRRQAMRRQATISRLRAQIAPDEVNSTEPPKLGLDPLVVASLPKCTYKLTNQLDHGEPIECSVCLSTIVEGATIRLLPNCKHMFHVECIDMWLESHTTCPICRMVPDPTVQPEDKELGTRVEATAPPLEEMEKAGGSGSRLGSFRKMFSRERSSRRIQRCGDEVGAADLERQ